MTHIGIQHHKTESCSCLIWFPVENKTPQDPGLMQDQRFHYGGLVPPVHAFIDTEPCSCAKGVIFLSHCSGGSMYNQSYLGEHLARQGFVVVAVEHNDPRDGITRKTLKANLLRRRAEIEQVWQEVYKSIEKCCGANAIVHFIGHSFGAFLGLYLLGVATDLDLELPKWDIDIRATVAIAPPLHTRFVEQDSVSLSISRLLLIGAENDEMVKKSPYLVKKKLLVQDKNFVVVPNSGHFSFLSEGTPIAKKMFPKIFADPYGEKATVHRKVCDICTNFILSHTDC